MALNEEAIAHLHNSPFPMGDCYELVQALGPAEFSAAFETLSQFQRRAQECIQKNVALVGIYSELSKRGLEELNELLDNITIAVHQQLERVKINEHDVLAVTFGLLLLLLLPLPHCNDLEDVGARGDIRHRRCHWDSRGRYGGRH
jgi:hypothetical protein